MKLTKAELEVLRKMGSVGGRKHSATLTKEQRQERARKASLARWGKAKKVAQ